MLKNKIIVFLRIKLNLKVYFEFKRKEILAPDKNPNAADKKAFKPIIWLTKKTTE